MRNNKKLSFIIHDNWVELFTNLDDKDAGELIKAICNYKLDKKINIEDNKLNAMFSMMKSTLDIDSFKYNNKVERMQKVNESKHNKKYPLIENENMQLEKVMELFNNTCILLKHCSGITKTRAEKIQELLNGYDLEEIQTVFEKVNKTDFLLGKNEKGWKANFDWIIDINNFVKVLEGSYDNNEPENKRKFDANKGIIKGNYDFKELEKNTKSNDYKISNENTNDNFEEIMSELERKKTGA